MEALSFKGKVVLVIGAGSPIGAETAHLFSKLGALLVLTDRNKSNLHKLDFECGGDCLLIGANLDKDEDVLNIFKQTINRFKKLDVVVNYAGVAEDGEGSGSASEAKDQIMNINVRQVYHVAVLAAPHLVKTKGNIVNVAAFISGAVLPHDLSYRVSRSALVQLTKCLAVQLAPDGVRVNAVSADLTGAVHGGAADHGKEVEKHLGTPTDVAAAVIFLASDSAASVVGANLPFDGGRHLGSTARHDNNGNGGHKEDEHQIRSAADRYMIQKEEQNKREVLKSGPANKQEHGKGEQPKREEHKEGPPKQTVSKDQKADQDKPTSKQDIDKNHQGKPSKH